MDEKPAGTIQVDCDDLDVVLAHLGVNGCKGVTSFWESAVPWLLDCLDGVGIKCTFFIVGSDLMKSEVLIWAREIIRRGHEIANHSYSHPFSFSSLPQDLIEKEITSAGRAIEELTGSAPLGFKAPDYDTSGMVNRVLEKCGYLYDSSVLPTFWGPILRGALRLRFKTLPRESNYLGRVWNGFAPIRPYYPGKEVWREEVGGRLIEIPVTTMPLIRIPFHASFVLGSQSLGFGMQLFETGLKLLSLRHSPVCYSIHLVDVADVDCLKSILSMPGRSLTPDTKRRIVSLIIEKLSESFRIMPAGMFASEWRFKQSQTEKGKPG